MNDETNDQHPEACPFCGLPAHYLERPEGWEVVCSSGLLSHCNLRPRPTKAEALAIWARHAANVREVWTEEEWAEFAKWVEEMEREDDSAQ